MHCALVSFDNVPMQAFLGCVPRAWLPSFGHAELRQPKSGPQFITGMQLVNLDIWGQQFILFAEFGGYQSKTQSTSGDHTAAL